MKLYKTINRSTDTHTYHKFTMHVPVNIIEQLGWVFPDGVGSIDVDMIVVGDRIMVRKLDNSKPFVKEPKKNEVYTYHGKSPQQRF